MQKQRLIWILFSLFLLSFLSQFSAAQTSSSGSISGKVLFPASLSAIPVAQEVTLHTISAEGMGEPQSQPINADGGFQFTGLSTDPQYTYLIVTQYQGVTYHSDRLNFTPQNSTIDQVAIRVYETTNDDAALVINRDHLLIDLLPTQIRVLEVLIIANTGDKTIIAKEGTKEYTAYFPLPSGFQEFQASEEVLPGSLQADQGGVALTRPVPPGVEQLIFTYFLPYQDPSYTFTKSLPYPTANVILLLTNPEVSISSNNLTDSGVITMGERQFRRLDGHGFLRNSTLTFTLQNLKETLPSSSPDASWLIYSAVGLLILLGFLYPFTFRRKQTVAPVKEAEDGQWQHGNDRSGRLALEKGTAEQTEKTREKLLRQIALLDAQYDQHLLDAEEYHKKRQELKEHLLEITVQLRRRGADS